MKKIMPRIVLASWCLWVLLRLVVVANHPIWHLGGTPAGWGIVVSSAAMPALGCWLVWRLYREPRGSNAIWFIVVGGLLIWKFLVGDILLRMLPAMGGHTLGGALVSWWAERGASPLSIALTVYSVVLLLFSIIYWPDYYLTHRVRNNARAIGTPLPESMAVCAECAKVFSKEDMICHGSLYVCPQCKPIFLQKLGEGARFDAGAPTGPRP